MTGSVPEQPDSPRWLHWLAMLAVCATIPLLALGAEVTTRKVGMADEIWPTYPWHLLLVSWTERGLGFLIEHSHRAAGYLLGCCVILLAIGLWRKDPRGWVRWLGIAVLGGVIVQGLLGGFRVRLNELLGTDLALIHGSFSHLVFALLVSLAVLTSRDWTVTREETGLDLSQLRRWSLVTACLVYLQLLLGAVVRHTPSTLGQRGHLLGAFAVVAAFAWLARTVYDLHVADPALHRALKLMGLLLAVQLLLGIEAWLTKYAGGVLPDAQRLTTGQALIRTAHFLVGSAVFATSVVLALRAHRQLVLNFHLAPSPLRQLEGVV